MKIASIANITVADPAHPTIAVSDLDLPSMLPCLKLTRVLLQIDLLPLHSSKRFRHADLNREHLAAADGWLPTPYLNSEWCLGRALPTEETYEKIEELSEMQQHKVQRRVGCVDSYDAGLSPVELSYRCRMVCRSSKSSDSASEPSTKEAIVNIVNAALRDVIGQPSASKPSAKEAIRTCTQLAQLAPAVFKPGYCNFIANRQNLVRPIAKFLSSFSMRTNRSIGVATDSWSSCLPDFPSILRTENTEGSQNLKHALEVRLWMNMANKAQALSSNPGKKTKGLHLESKRPQMNEFEPLVPHGADLLVAEMLPLNMYETTREHTEDGCVVRSFDLGRDERFGERIILTSTERGCPEEEKMLRRYRAHPRTADSVTSVSGSRQANEANSTERGGVIHADSDPLVAASVSGERPLDVIGVNQLTHRVTRTRLGRGLLIDKLKDPLPFTELNIQHTTISKRPRPLDQTTPSHYYPTWNPLEHRNLSSETSYDPGVDSFNVCDSEIFEMPTTEHPSLADVLGDDCLLSALMRRKQSTAMTIEEQMLELHNMYERDPDMKLLNRQERSQTCEEEDLFRNFSFSRNTRGAIGSSANEVSSPDQEDRIEWRLRDPRENLGSWTPTTPMSEKSPQQRPSLFKRWSRSSKGSDHDMLFSEDTMYTSRDVDIRKRKP